MHTLFYDVEINNQDKESAAFALLHAEINLNDSQTKSKIKKERNNDTTIIQSGKNEVETFPHMACLYHRAGGTSISGDDELSEQYRDSEIRVV